MTFLKPPPAPSPPAPGAALSYQAMAWDPGAPPRSPRPRPTRETVLMPATSRAGRGRPRLPVLISGRCPGGGRWRGAGESPTATVRMPRPVESLPTRCRAGWPHRRSERHPILSHLGSRAAGKGRGLACRWGALGSPQQAAARVTGMEWRRGGSGAASVSTEAALTGATGQARKHRQRDGRQHSEGH